jgi:hypothetical protein
MPSTKKTADLAGGDPTAGAGFGRGLRPREYATAKAKFMNDLPTVKRKQDDQA